MSKSKDGEVTPAPKRAVRVSLKTAPVKPVTAIAKQKMARKKTVHVHAKSKKESDIGRIAIIATESGKRKIQILENISKRKQKDTVTSKPSSKVLLSRIHTALLVPLRMHLDNTQLASSVARYAGTVFVITGAFLALYNMHALASYVTDTGRSFTAQTISNCVPGTVCPNGSTTSPASTLNPTPTADIAVESPNTTLVNTLPVNVSVPYATRVDLIAHNNATNQDQTIGIMSRISDLAWRTYWQTLAFEDGEYTLKAVITNQFGTYTNTKTTVYRILNHPIDTTTATSPGITASSSDPITSTATTTTDTSATVATTTSTTDTSVVTSHSTINVRLGTPQPLSKETALTTLVEGATQIKHFLRKSGTTQSTMVGSATLRTTGEWKFLLNVEILPDGNYDIITQVFFLNGTSNTKILERIAVKNVVTETDVATTTVQAQPVTQVVETEALAPLIQVTIAGGGMLTGVTDTYVSVTGATFVELYAQPDGSLTSKFIGLAVRLSDTAWRHRFDTTQLPNGTYGIFARVRHAYGDSESSKVRVQIVNTVQTLITPEKTTYLDSLKNAVTESERILQGEQKSALTPKVQFTADKPISDSESSEGSVVSKDTQLAPERQFVSNFKATYAIEEDIGDDYTSEVNDVLEEFMKDINKIMREYARAVRLDDTEKAKASLDELTGLRENVIKKLPFAAEKADILRKINIHIESIVKDLKDRTERSEAILKERIGDGVTKDSDSDSVSDYDELNLYKTDPFSADSDNDGFIDGVEILNGYDPKDAKREANIQYESPRELGLVREDLLAVTSITTISVDDAKPEDIKAHIGGTALPNSFVTLYVFSTPIVITVKTDTDGNWSYIFDKELENGEHEVYIGLTDNAGKIVAKSNPLSFIKTAQAFTPVDASEASPVSATPEEPALIDQNMMFIIGSFAVVALGLVLILLGLHVKPKNNELQLA